MRLIDKDRLLKGSNHYWLEMENFGDIESIDVRFVEMAEEVKAIPIEWILKWACEFIDPNSEGYKMAMELVHDWEKENDKNI